MMSTAGLCQFCYFLLPALWIFTRSLLFGSAIFATLLRKMPNNQVFKKFVEKDKKRSIKEQSEINAMYFSVVRAPAMLHDTLEFFMTPLSHPQIANDRSLDLQAGSCTLHLLRQSHAQALKRALKRTSTRTRMYRHKISISTHMN
jgi:hypothetical protein